MTCTCDGNPTGIYLCRHCQHTLEVALMRVADYADAAEDVRTRQTRIGNGGRSPGKRTKGEGATLPMLVDERWVDYGDGQRALDDARNTIGTWARIVMDERPEVAGPTCGTPCLHTSCNHVRISRWPRDTIRAMCAYLDRQHRWIEGRDWAPELLSEVTYTEGTLRRLVDRPRERWYAGKCACDADLYAHSGRRHATVRCGHCGTEWDLASRREFLLQEAEHVLVSATEAAEALSSWTDYDGRVETLAGRIRQWRSRGMVEVVGTIVQHGKIRPLFRLGDLRAALEEDARRKALSMVKKQRKTRRVPA